MKIHRLKTYLNKYDVLLFYDNRLEDYLFFNTLNIHNDFISDIEYKRYIKERKVNYTYFIERVIYVRVSI